MNNDLPHETQIEVIAKKGKHIKKKIMTYGEALELKSKKSGWTYDFFELGFSAYELT